MSARQSAGGRTRQAQIRAVLGESGYRRYQQVLGRAGGIARQAQLRSALGETGYSAHQRTLYQRAVQKHGAVKMRAILTAVNSSCQVGVFPVEHPAPLACSHPSHHGVPRSLPVAVPSTTASLPRNR